MGLKISQLQYRNLCVIYMQGDEYNISCPNQMKFGNIYVIYAGWRVMQNQNLRDLTE